MKSVSSGSAGRRPPSLPERYEEFLAQRIEEYKEQLPRHELLTLGDAALEQLRTDESGQLSLTEVVLRDHVDHLIRRDLKLPSYRSWRNRFIKLRAAQRQATHWGIEGDQPLLEHVGRMESESAVVIGTGAAGYGFLMASHDVRVIIIDRDIGTVETSEDIAVKEWLDAQVETLVVDLEYCPENTLMNLLTSVPRFDGSHVGLVLFDSRALGQIPTTRRTELLDALRNMTVPGGSHLMPPAPSSGDGVSLSSDALRAVYGEWITSRPDHHQRQSWFVATKPVQNS